MAIEHHKHRFFTFFKQNSCFTLFTGRGQFWPELPHLIHWPAVFYNTKQICYFYTRAEGNFGRKSYLPYLMHWSAVFYNTKQMCYFYSRAASNFVLESYLPYVTHPLNKIHMLFPLLGPGHKIFFLS